jgi:hypothetical protein
MATIGEAITYPLKKFWRLFYWLWALIPVIGWISYIGYTLRLTREVMRGNKKEAPKYGKFWENFNNGLFPFIVILAINIISMFIAPVLKKVGVVGNILYYLLALLIGFLLGVMVLQYIEKWRIEDFFKIGRAFSTLFGNFGSFIVMLLKQLVASIVFLIMSIPIITMLFTMPAMGYSKNMLLADWYRNANKPRK